MPLPLPVLVAAAAVMLAFGVHVMFKRRRRRETAARAYLKGFRYILSDEPDAALEELTRIADVDASTVETYLALGALFRRTGDHERAIRLHQNMLLRPNLQAWLKEQIQYELALDFHRAGMLERAAEAYRRAVDEPSGAHRRDALTGLRQLYEERSDFAHAAEAQGRLIATGEGSPRILAHLLAAAALSEGELALADAFARKASETDPACAHAAWARGLVASRAGRLEEAGDWLERACRLDPELAPRASEALVAARGEEGRRFFAGLISGEDHPAVRLALGRSAKAAGRTDEALRHLRRALELDSRYLEARVELGRTLLESSSGDEARAELEALFTGLKSPESAFCCQACGHGYSEPPFRCARCHGWDTVRRAVPMA